MTDPRYYHDIVEITETPYFEKANDVLKKGGWELLKITEETRDITSPTENKIIVYVLGRRRWEGIQK